MSCLRTRDALWPIFLHGLAHIQHAATPFNARVRVCFHFTRVRFFYPRKLFVDRVLVRPRAAKASVLYRAIKIVPVAQIERALVAMKLYAPCLLAMKADVKVGRQACHRSTGKLDGGDGEIGRRNVEGNALFRDTIRIQYLAKSGHAACRAEDRRENGQGIDTHIKERSYLVKGARSRVPGLDAPPIDLRVGHTYRPQQTITNGFPGRLLPFAQDGDGRTAETTPFLLRQC